MNHHIESISKVKLSEEFKILVAEFEKRFDGEEGGFLKLSEYIGFDSVVNKNEVRSYELVPFEAELPFPTGSNGEHMGWLNLCPEIKNYRKPFINWTPLGAQIFYHGIYETEIIENSVKYLHGDEYEGIDLGFLKTIGINPVNGDPIQLINCEDDVLKEIPIEIPESYRFEITKDGVGVLANKQHFAPFEKHISQNHTSKEMLRLALAAFQNEY